MSSRRARRSARRRLLIVGALILVFATIAALLASSSWVESSLRGWAERRLDAQWPGSRIARLQIDWLPLELAASGLHIALDPEGSTLDVAHLEVSPTLGALLGRGLHLRRVALDRPQLVLTPGAEQESSDFDPGVLEGLRIDELEVVGGSLVVGSDRIPIQLTAAGVDLRSPVAADAQAGRIDVAQLVLLAPDRRSGSDRLEASLALDLRRKTTGFDVTAIRATLPGVAVTGAGSLDWSDGLGVDLGGSAGIDFAELELVDEIGGEAEADFDLSWSRDGWVGSAQVTTPRVVVDEHSLTDVVVRAELGGSPRVTLQRARWLDGELQASAQPSPSSSEWRLEVEWNGVRWGRLWQDELLTPTGRRFVDAPLRGMARLRVDPRRLTEWRGEASVDWSTPIDQADWVGRAELQRRGAEVEVVAEGGWRGAEATTEVRLTSDFGSSRGNAAVRLDRVDVLSTLLLDAQVLEPWLRRAGSAGLTTNWNRDAQLRTQLTVRDLLGRGRGGLLNADLVSRGSTLEIESLDLTRGRSRITAGGVVALDAPLERSQLSVRADDWPIHESLATGLAWADPALGGQLTGTLEWLNATGTLSLRSSDLSLAGRGLGAARLEAVLEREGLVLDQLLLATSAGDLRFTGPVGWTAEGVIDLSLENSRLSFEELLRWAGAEAEGHGDVLASGHFGGSLLAPEWALEVATTGLMLDGGELDPSTWAFALSQDAVEAEGDFLGLGALAARGRLDRDGLAIDLKLEGARLAELAGLYGLTDLEGRAHATARLEGPFSGLQLAARVDAERVSYKERELVTIEPAELRVHSDGVEWSLWVGDPAEEDDLFFGGRIAGEDRGIDAVVQGAADATWLTALFPDLDLLGRLELLATIRGTFDAPRANGILALRDGRWVNDSLPHSLERLEIVSLLGPERILVDRVHGSFGGGELDAQADIDLTVTPPSVVLRSTLDGARVLFPDGWQSEVGAEVTVTSEIAPEPAVEVSGVVQVLDTLYGEDIDRGFAQLLRTLLAREPVLTDPHPALHRTRLNLEIVGPGALHVRNNVAQIDGSVDLTLRGTLAQPSLFGEVGIRSGGTIDYGGDEYTVQRGTLSFENPALLEPMVDLVAKTRRRDYDIELHLTGTLDRLDARMRSDPPLPEIEVLSLLASGERLNGGGVREITTAADEQSVAAADLIYSQATSLVEDRFTKLFGLDRIRLHPVASGDALSSARVTVAKRIGRDVVVTYSSDPSSTDVSVLEIEWRMSDRIVLVLSQNADSSYSVEARVEQRFQ